MAAASMLESLTLKLVPENSSFQGFRTVICSQPITLGRLVDGQPEQTASSVRFNSKVVSRQHCRILALDGKV